jgi:hypothetical protein
MEEEGIWAQGVGYNRKTNNSLFSGQEKRVIAIPPVYQLSMRT